MPTSCYASRYSSFSLPKSRGVSDTHRLRAGASGTLAPIGRAAQPWGPGDFPSTLTLDATGQVS